jgi:hypothetical protein
MKSAGRQHGEPIIERTTVLLAVAGLVLGAGLGVALGWQLWNGDLPIPGLAPLVAGGPGTCGASDARRRAERNSQTTSEERTRQRRTVDRRYTSTTCSRRQARSSSLR